jgi:2-dehydropantoate 2-reductase
MRMAVFGAGGIGAYYGSRFAAGGVDVHLIARGSHLAALQADGLTVVTDDHGTMTLRLPATDDPATIGPVDFVLFCVKSYDTESAALRLPPLIHAETGVISLQNGIDNEARLAAVVGWPHILGGGAYIFASIRAPGVVWAGGPRAITVAEWGGGQASPRVTRLLAAAEAAGIEAHLAPDIQAAKWEKYVLLAAFSAVSAATRLPLGDIRRSPAAVDLLRGLMTEVANVGRATGVALPDDLVDRQLGLLRGQDAGSTASLYHDLVHGHRMEIEALQGATVRLGMEAGVATPLMSVAYAILQPWALRNERQPDERLPIPT